MANAIKVVLVSGSDVAVSTAAGLPVNVVAGSISATLAGFQATAGATANITDIVNVSQDVLLPAGTDMVITNKGSVALNFRMQTGAGTAVATDLSLAAGAATGLHITTETHLSAIAPTGTGTGATAGQLNIQGGIGLASGYGGGSIGGGASSAVTADIIKVNGVTALANAGATGAGSLRVTAAQDVTTVAGAAPTTTGIYVTGPAAAALATSTLQTTINTNITTANTNLTNITGTKAAGTAAANAALVGGVFNTTPPTVGNGQQVALQLSAAGRVLVDAAITGGGDASAANQTVVQAVIGAATAPTKMEAVGGVYNSTPLTLTNGQSSALQLDANGYLNVDVKSATGVAQGSTTAGQTSNLISGAVTTASPTYTTAQTSPLSLDTTGALRVNVTAGGGTVTGGTDHDASASGVDPVLAGGYASAAAPTSVSADGDAVNGWYLRNGAQATVLTAAGALIGGDAANGLDVDITRISALVAGSALIGKVGIDQTTPGTTNAVVVSSTVGISQGAAIAGITTSPISAESLSTTPTRTTAQVDILLQTLAGNLCVQPYGLPDTGVSGLTAAMTSTTSTAVTGVGATASKFNYITSLVVGNSHATVGTFVELQDGSGGTTFFTVPAAAVYGGVALTFPKPLKQPTANTALYVKNTTSGANVIVSVVGYQAL